MSPGRGRGAGRTVVPLALFVLICAVAGVSASGTAAGDLGPVTLSQSGSSLVVRARTAEPLNLQRLQRQPDPGSRTGRRLCLTATRAGQGAGLWICLGGPRKTRRRVGVIRVGPDRRVLSRKTIPARVGRDSPTRLVLRLDPSRAGMLPGSYRWQMTFLDSSCGSAEAPESCAGTYPDGHRATYRLRPVRAVGCTGGNGQMVLRGPRKRKRVALTFDDGPGPYTGAVLRQLRRFRIHATFFMLGMQVGSYPGLARKVAKAGHEIASHSSVHALLPGHGDIVRSVRVIHRTTGFRPCLFRPPYGATSRGLSQAVRRARMKNVIWDVDTQDWRRPGAGSIRAAITRGVRPGSIVLMHDAGGPRGQTVSALPQAIRTLRRRGYRFVTVSELLGNRFIYRPVP